MMIERNVFRIKYGKMKEAKAIWLKICETLTPALDTKFRLLTDLTGPAYTLVMEIELRDFNHIEVLKEKWTSSTEVVALYQQFILVCDSSERTLFQIEF